MTHVVRKSPLQMFITLLLCFDRCQYLDCLKCVFFREFLIKYFVSIFPDASCVFLFRDLTQAAYNRPLPCLRQPPSQRLFHELQIVGHRLCVCQQLRG